MKGEKKIKEKEGEKQLPKGRSCGNLTPRGKQGRGPAATVPVPVPVPLHQASHAAPHQDLGQKRDQKCLPGATALRGARKETKSEGLEPGARGSCPASQRCPLGVHPGSPHGG